MGGREFPDEDGAVRLDGLGVPPPATAAPSEKGTLPENREKISRLRFQLWVRIFSGRLRLAVDAGQIVADAIRCAITARRGCCGTLPTTDEWLSIGEPMESAKTKVAISLLISGLSCGLPFLFPPGEWDYFIRISLWLALLWSAVLIFSVVRYRKKGLWFLVGLPLVLYWPYVLFAIGAACAHDVKNCP